MMRHVSRRQFLSTSAAATSALALGAYVNTAAAQESKSPNEKLNILGVGTTGRAGADLKELGHENIIALADVDDNLIAKAGALFPDARKYRDFRVMFEKEAEKADAVMVGTPDHTHAPAAAMALRMGKHVYCEKPLTHTILEARTLSTLAAEKKLKTQMGNQIHSGDNYRRVVELIQAGAIGNVAEVHVWAAASYYGGKFTMGSAAPAGLDWDLFLGPAPERPYSEGVHPFNWRKFWDYGTGALGDFGCHYMDLAHWALDLRDPTAIEATGPKVDAVSTPEWCIAKYDYPARGKRGPVKLTWYDSGRRPKILATLKRKDGSPLEFKSGQLFVGSEGMLISDYNRLFLLPEDKFLDYKRPEQTIAKSLGQHREWTEAIKNDGTPLCNFDYAGALTEAVMLGTVAYRSGKKIEWDAKNLKVTNAPEAQQFVHKEYRKGWTL